MPSFEIINLFLPIIICALLGFVFAKFKRMDIKSLADFIIYIASPALVIYSLSNEHLQFTDISAIAISAALVILGAGVITFCLAKLFRLSLPTGLYLPIMFMNSGFIGYPISYFIFGHAGLSRAIIYDIMNAILIFTVGIYLVSRRRDHWQILKMPFIYAVLIGLAISFWGIKIPHSISASFGIIGNAAIPLAIFMLGYRLAGINFSSWKTSLLASALRIGVGFSLAFLIINLFKLGAINRQIILLSSSLPSAFTTIALAEEYDADPELVASTIAFSTLLCLIILPFLLTQLVKL